MMVALLLAPQAKQSCYHEGEVQDSAVSQEPARELPWDGRNPINLPCFPPATGNLLFPNLNTGAGGSKTFLLLSKKKKKT